MPAGGARPGAGRKRGQPNRATQERAAIAELEAKARNAELEIIRAKAANHKLAKEHMQDFIPVLAGMAAYYQPTFPGMPQQNPRGDAKEFERWFTQFLNIARTLAPYESPTFRAIDLRATLPNDREANPLEVMKALLGEIDGESRLERQQTRQIEHLRPSGAFAPKVVS